MQSLLAEGQHQQSKGKPFYNGQSQKSTGKLPFDGLAQQNTGKLTYINNLRILLTILIVLLHLAITYGAEGSWYYYEHTRSIPTNVLLTLFTAVVQSFALGLFFMISGYFVPGSYKRKGAKRFMKDRLLRLGIPFLAYYFIISPALVYTLYVKLMGKNLAFQELFGSGPLWFVEALLIFTAVYVSWRHFAKPEMNVPVVKASAPSGKNILVFAAGLSLANFLVRIWFPMGTGFSNLQFGFFPGYIGLFVVGIAAYREKWFERFFDDVGKRWLKISGAAILVFPVTMILGGALEDVAPFMGGFHWQSLLFSTWEAFVGIGLIAGLFVIFRNRFNHQGDLAKTLAANAYTVYIIHAPIIVFFAYSVRGIIMYPLLKFLWVSVVAVALCFLISRYIIRNIPYAQSVL